MKDLKHLTAEYVFEYAQEANFDGNTSDAERATEEYMKKLWSNAGEVDSDVRIMILDIAPFACNLLGIARDVACFEQMCYGLRNAYWKGEHNAAR